MSHPEETWDSRTSNLFKEKHRETFILPNLDNLTEH